MDPYQLRLEAAERLIEAQDYEGALAVYRELAGGGCAQAQHALGTLYTLGVGCECDGDKGVKWLECAGEQGIAAAWLNIGTTYTGGAGNLPPDLAKAHEYYRRAVEAGCPIVPWLEPLLCDEPKPPVSLDRASGADDLAEGCGC